MDNEAKIELAHQIISRRPSPDEGMEQFLLTPEGLLHQAEFIAQRAHKRLLLIGDDDHLSVMLVSLNPALQLTVVEGDPRVLRSIKRLLPQAANCRLVEADIRGKVETSEMFDCVYGNPPWSSKNSGHGIRYWLSRGLDLAPRAIQIIAMPSNDNIPWINENWLSVQEYAARNGLRFIEIDDYRARYLHTNHPGLTSQNLVMRRVNESRRQVENARSGERLYR